MGYVYIFSVRWRVKEEGLQESSADEGQRARFTAGCARGIATGR